jgi:hypothetical protein
MAQHPVEPAQDAGEHPALGGRLGSLEDARHPLEVTVLGRA